MTSICDARCLHDSNLKRSKIWGWWVLGIVCMEKQGQHKILPECGIALRNLHQVGHAQMLRQICRSLRVWGLYQKLQGYFWVQSLFAVLECCRHGRHKNSELPTALKALHCKFDLNACRWVRAAAGHGSMGLLEWHGNEIEVDCFCQVFSPSFYCFFFVFLWSVILIAMSAVLWDWSSVVMAQIHTNQWETTDNQEKCRRPKSLEFVKPLLGKKWQHCRYSAWIFVIYLYIYIYIYYACRYRDCNRFFFFFWGATYVYVLFFVNLTGYALGVGGTASMAQHAFLEDWKPAGSPRF